MFDLYIYFGFAIIIFLFQWVRPKIVAQTIIVIGFLTDFNLWMALINIPAAAWVIYE